MKTIQLILIITILIGCDYGGQPNESQEKINAIKEEAVKVSNNQYPDEVKLNKIEKSNVESQKQDTIPNWIKKLHESKDNLPSYVYEQAVIEFKNLNDSVSWGVIDRNTGVCNQKILITYVRSREINREEIESHCDHDMSNPKYSWMDFEFLTNDHLIVHKFVESVHDSFVNERGMLKNELDYEELEKQIDSTRVILKIDENGKIKKE